MSSSGGGDGMSGVGGQQQEGAAEHGAPGEGAECLCCLEDLDAGNYVEYRATAGTWVCMGLV